MEVKDPGLSHKNHTRTRAGIDIRFHRTPRWRRAGLAPLTQAISFMLRMASGVILAVALLLAQPRSPLLLPDSHRIVGVVLDEEGNPVAGTSVDHVDSRTLVMTDAKGKFDVSTDAPAFVIRKAGYRSLFLNTESAARPGAPELQVVLPRSAARLRVCSGGEIADDVYGYRISFLFPAVPGVTTKPFRDIEYSGEWHYVNTSNGAKGIQHAGGPMWGGGTPADDDVWKSVRYEEVTYGAGRITVVDARGEYANGLRWRFLGKFGETAIYDDMDTKSAALLDRVLDGVCLAVSQP